MKRGLAYRRHQRERVIRRKKRIDKANNISLRLYAHPWYADDNRYNKGKIHCSCWMCSNKTNARGVSISDRRKQIKQSQDIEYMKSDSYK